MLSMNFSKIAGFVHYNFKKLIILIGIVLVIGIIFFGTKTNEKTVDASTINVKNFKCITIDTDDTLWSIASENISEEYPSIESYIDEVKSINNLTNDKIYSGATLVIPYYVSPM